MTGIQYVNYTEVGRNLRVTHDQSMADCFAALDNSMDRNIIAMDRTHFRCNPKKYVFELVPLRTCSMDYTNIIPMRQDE